MTTEPIVQLADDGVWEVYNPQQVKGRIRARTNTDGLKVPPGRVRYLRKPPPERHQASLRIRVTRRLDDAIRAEAARTGKSISTIAATALETLFPPDNNMLANPAERSRQ